MALLGVPIPGGDTRDSALLPKDSLCYFTPSPLLQSSLGLKEKQGTHNLLERCLESKWGSLECVRQRQKPMVREQVQILFISTFRHLNKHLSPLQVPAGGVNVSPPVTVTGEPFSRTCRAVNSSTSHFREAL